MSVITLNGTSVAFTFWDASNIHDVTSGENAKYRRGDIDVLDWEDDSELYVRNYFAEPWQDVHELKSAHQH